MIDSKLTTFINIAKLKSYTKTAELLNLTQPAVTQHIKLLEEYYKVKLIHKDGRQISLTAEGELLLKYAKELEANSLIFERKITNQSSIIKRYNLGATLTIGEFVLPALLGDFKRKNSNIDVIMHVHNLEEILNKMNSGEIDLGIVEGPFDKNKFKYQKLRDDSLVLVASPNNDIAKDKNVEIYDVIKSGRLIMRENGSGTRMVLENNLLQIGINLADMKIYMEVGSIGAIKSLVEANLGYTIISKEAVKREVEAGSLVIIPIQDFHIVRELNFVYLEQSPIDFIERFINFIILSMLK